MSKRAYFDTFDGKGWPSLDQLRPYFLSPPGQRWFFESGNDGAALHLQSGEPTGDPDELRKQDAVHFYMDAHPVLGVYLLYMRWDARQQRKQSFHSKGDLARLREQVRNLHGTALPAGLFVSYEAAWRAVKEFVETDGALPTSIEWIAPGDLPEGIFPER